jgi:hypothetical protein
MQKKHRRRKVVCRGCTHLLVFGDEEPLCLAKAKFVDSPYCRRVDVVGVRKAGKVNAQGDCKLKQWISFHGYVLHRWFVRDLRGRGFKGGFRSLKAYERRRIKNV